MKKFFSRMALTLVALYVVGALISASFDVTAWTLGIRWLVSMGFLAVFSTVSIMEYYDNKSKPNE